MKPEGSFFPGVTSLAITPAMIEAILSANGFDEAGDFLKLPHIANELLGMARRAGRRETEQSIRES
jgi:hypothetical protein